MAAIPEDDLESCSPREMPEVLPVLKAASTCTSMCEHPGCVETADEPCACCQVFFCHDHFGKCHTCKTWPLCTQCLRPPNHQCRPPPDDQYLRQLSRLPANVRRAAAQAEASFRRRLAQDILRRAPQCRDSASPSNLQVVDSSLFTSQIKKRRPRGAGVWAPMQGK